MRYPVDVHIHTTASGHAFSTLQENARHAASLGLKLIACTDHAMAMPGGPGWIYFSALRMVPRVVEGIEVLRGVEANILDYAGKLDIETRFARRLDLVIASYHDVCIKPADAAENTRGLAAVMELGFVDIIGHPGNPIFPIDIPAFVKKARETDTLIEINNSSLGRSRKGSESNCLEIAREARRLGAKLILNSDAHISYDIGQLDQALALVDAAGVPAEQIMNTDPDKLKAYLSGKGKIKDLYGHA
ncbi:MAG: phosphatase [Clostridiaceae bacterium]|nr:phosphatase [Clostridiaceae bacterium]